MKEDPRTTESLLTRRELAEKATPGPWFAIHADDGACMNASYVATKDEDAPPEEAYRNIVALTLYQAKHVACHEDERWDENAAHIAANAPSTVMADIDEILRLRAEVNYWQQEARDSREIFERMYARLKKEADWLAQSAANNGWHGVRVSPSFMHEKARRAVEEQYPLIFKSMGDTSPSRTAQSHVLAGRRIFARQFVGASPTREQWDTLLHGRQSSPVCLDFISSAICVVTLRYMFSIIHSQTLSNLYP